MSYWMSPFVSPTVNRAVVTPTTFPEDIVLWLLFSQDLGACEGQSPHEADVYDLQLPWSLSWEIEPEGDSQRASEGFESDDSQGRILVLMVPLG